MASKKKSSKSSAPTTMEELLEKTGYNIKTFTQGEKVEAELLEKGDRSASFDIGGKSEGILVDEYFDEAQEYLKTINTGDTVKATIVNPETREGGIMISLENTVTDSYWEDLKKAKEEDTEIKVSGKGVSGRGLTVSFGPLTGYIPSSQIGKETSRDLNKLVGKSFAVKVMEVDRDKRRIVLSERAVSEAGEIELQKRALEEVKEDDVYKGIVTQITNFGAFVEIEVEVDGKKVPVEGLVHISELSWDKVDETSDEVSEGDEVEVAVLGVDDSKLALSIKHAQADPWEEIEEKYKKDDRVSGTVVRISDFGAFVLLEPGVEGLLHITKIPPGTDLKEGQDVNVYVEEVNKEERRISLGLVLTSKPVGYK